MPEEIENAILWFKRIYLDGIPVLLEQEKTAFLSFVCVVAAIDALAGYRYRDMTEGDRFRRFVTAYFPSRYEVQAERLWLFRCRMLHNFSPAYFSLVHSFPEKHLQPSTIDTFLNDGDFFADLRDAAETYFSDLQAREELQGNMLSRLRDTERGGSIAVVPATN